MKNVTRSRYNARAMSSQAARLKEARIQAGFDTAKEAAEHFGWKVSSYAAHENGQNKLKVDVAERYSKAFNVPKEWLLLGLHGQGESAAIEGELRLLSPEQRAFVLAGLRNLIDLARKQPRK